MLCGVSLTWTWKRTNTYVSYETIFYECNAKICTVWEKKKSGIHFWLLKYKEWEYYFQILIGHPKLLLRPPKLVSQCFLVCLASVQTGVAPSHPNRPPELASVQLSLRLASDLGCLGGFVCLFCRFLSIWHMLEEGNSTEKMASIRSGCRQTCRPFNDWCGRAQLSVGNATSEQVALGFIRQQAEQEVSSIPAWPLHRVLPCLLWMMDYKLPHASGICISITLWNQNPVLPKLLLDIVFCHNNRSL